MAERVDTTTMPDCITNSKRFQEVIKINLNLDKNIVTLKGKPTNEKLSDVLANILAMSTVGRPAKMITWAVNLTNDGEIEISEDDIEFLEKIIEDNMYTINLAKAQLLDEIDKLRVS